MDYTDKTGESINEQRKIARTKTGRPLRVQSGVTWNVLAGLKADLFGDEDGVPSVEKYPLSGGTFAIEPLATTHLTVSYQRQNTAQIAGGWTSSIRHCEQIALNFLSNRNRQVLTKDRVKTLIHDVCHNVPLKKQCTNISECEISVFMSRQVIQEAAAVSVSATQCKLYSACNN